MSGYRLSVGGTLVDPATRLSFRFDDKAYQGLAGDSLASALLAGGVSLFGRSFKYHRRRGLFAAGPEEPNALVELRGGARREPNLKAPVVELYDGLEAWSQNRWPSLGFDLMAVNGLLDKLFVAGFYYKTFKWPSSFWEKLYEPLIRRAAGLGRLSGEPDPDSYETATAHADLLVVGSGPAGLLAARTAARAGRRVILVERDARLGGSLLTTRRTIDGQPGAAWAAAVEAELAAAPHVRILRRTTVFGTYDGGQFGALERVADHLPVPPPHCPRQRAWTLVAGEAIVAAGAIERPIVFPGNDLPGVMLAGALRHYAVGYGAAAGRAVTLFTANDSGWHAAADLIASGVTVAAVIDPRADVAPVLTAAVAAGGGRALAGARLRRALGGKALEAIDVDLPGGGSDRIATDALGVSGNWQPDIQLATHRGDRPVWSDAHAAFTAGKLPPGIRLAGAAAGTFRLADIFAAGATEAAVDHEGAALTPFWHVGGTMGAGKAFVDFQHDVTDADVALAAREGYVSVEHLKRYTTLGMATDQGRTANLNGLAILAELTGRTIPQTGITTMRPPVEPVAIGALAGHHRAMAFRPRRLPPIHMVAVEREAQMIEVGPWWRAQWFPLPHETDWQQSVDREVTTVRKAVGVCDMSTLGKIEVFGPDAAAFLTRLCANSVMKLAVGRCAYFLMLREDGYAYDDGTVARLGPERFVMTCSTAHAAKVYEQVEYARQVLFPEMDVVVQSATEQWAQLALAGPRARDVLARIVDPGFDLSGAAFPPVACAETTVLGGVRARLFRLTFSGELAFEIAVPARRGADLMRRLLIAGQDFGIVPYGTEAVGAMRIEKGHPVGSEINGQTSAHMLGLGAFAERKHDCIGRVLAARPYLTDPARGRLVGLKPVDRAARLRAGAHLLPKGPDATAAHDQGWITSVAHSPTLGCWIGLGFLAHGDKRHGEIVRAYDPVRGGDVEVEVVAPCFVDPEGNRARA
ncbi:sarcosine oxidase subunit alpha [Prosthecomicrobium hirschii]|uniref:sarcosine oxidase subunit alpha family protein n=1 Tax=Prosthecodimorpha hirschii TaxID=665126 RepID=UPI00112870B0|nr:sarcosine oxidase subunit alpha family protein [Prosthecomicrobium hirschii]TPQ52263.1 sarcosine oxidase subunit alpha [Prosthecomicrobium hirschii]